MVHLAFSFNSAFNSLELSGTFWKKILSDLSMLGLSAPSVK